MITRAIITANSILAGLTDEQILAIETLSRNDEEATIGSRIGEIYRSMDSTIEQYTGIARNGDEKTYKYLERAVKSVKESAAGLDTYKAQIEALTADKARLEKAIAEGATSGAAAEQLKAVRAELDETKSQFNKLKSDFDKAKAAHVKELRNARVDFELADVVKGLKFNSAIPESAREVLVKQAIDKVRTAYKPDYVDDGKGGQRLVFHTEAGAVMNNPENQLNPYTATEILSKELRTMGILDEGRQQTGGGTHSSTGAQGGGSHLDLSGARTQAEAYDMIAQSLMSRGLTTGSAEFQSAMDQSWSDNNVSQLPTR